ncbi:hypothetical protein ACIBF6_45415 [Streptosporangium amethystogenes]|uniref:hypothetical protein n=1 Tax=Streptosporangium amethystogenes TaxID=2002 RepID=UPI0037B24273
MREHFNADWTFGLIGWIQSTVAQHYRNDLYHWPMQQSSETEVYQGKDEFRIFVMRDRGPSSAIPAVNGKVIPWPEEAPEVSISEGLKAHEKIQNYFGLRQQDLVFIVPEVQGNSIEEDWSLLSETEHEWLRLQLEHNIGRQLYYVRGFESMKKFFLPPGYEFLSRECEKFFLDHPDYERNVFLMTRFDPSNLYLTRLDTEIRRALREHNLNPVRADDKVYMPDRNLWNNVCVYMLCSFRGIAILEDRAEDEFNPNVALEYGFMRALNKDTLLLADRGFRNLRADVVGTLRETFDLLDIEGTIPPAIARWLR